MRMRCWVEGCAHALLVSLCRVTPRPSLPVLTRCGAAAAGCCPALLLVYVGDVQAAGGPRA